MNGIRLLIDTSKCIGCKACQIACQQWHSLSPEDTIFAGSYQNPPDMSAANLTVTKFIENTDAKLSWLFFKDQCRQCNDPPCLKACPFRAIIRQADGIVRIDPAQCFPSRCSSSQIKPCQDECEFDEIPRYRYLKDGREVITKMRKCDFCYDRINNATLNAQSKKPACQIACPPGAISFGNADPLLAEALNRVNYLRTRGWPDAKVYPDQLEDSTHVIWVLTKRESQYGQGD